MADKRRDLLKVLAESAAQLAHSQEVLVRTHQLMLDLVSATDEPAGSEAPSPRPRRPFIKSWRTYDGFRQDMVAREREALRHNKPPITKHQVAEQTGYDSVRTIARTMKENYHLDPDRDWPPSSWPEHEPDGDLGNGHAIAALYCGVFVYGLLDYLSDGRLDLVISFGKLACRGFSGQV